GYYIACGANKIVAEPSTITGSIGVVGGKPVVKGLYDWLGITNEYVMRGKNAGMFRETEKFNDSERKKFEQFLNSTYEDFITKVGKGRNRDKKDIDAIGQGRVWTGQQGKDRGLVDEYGGLDRAIEVAKQLAKIPAGSGIQRIIMPKPPTFFEQLMSSGGDEESVSASAQLRQQESVMSVLPADVRHAFRYAQLLDRAKNEPMYLLPFDLRIR
ncbi:MAG TPA: S49 family peptidase, partial [Pyrinomonadaceae bacterium]|nr:S49 family peptidase [Pyrinomonadaceae bacterium]